MLFSAILNSFWTIRLLHMSLSLEYILSKPVQIIPNSICMSAVADKAVTQPVHLAVSCLQLPAWSSPSLPSGSLKLYHLMSLKVSLSQIYRFTLLLYNRRTGLVRLPTCNPKGYDFWGSMGYSFTV